MATQRAMIDGTAGVCIEVNPNIIDSDGIQYAGTALYLFKAQSPLDGKKPWRIRETSPGQHYYYNFGQPNQGAPVYHVEVERPYNHTPNRPLIRPGDKISFSDDRGCSNIKYTIVKVYPNLIENVYAPTDPDRILLQLAKNNDWGNPNSQVPVVLPEPLIPDLPVPPVSPEPANDRSYWIHRGPRLIESTRLELPEGYIIDLRYSGPLLNSVNGYPRMNLNSAGPLSPRTIFHDVLPVVPPIPGNPVPRNRDICFYFSEGLEQITTFGGVAYRPMDDIHLFISKFEWEPAKETIRSLSPSVSGPGNPNGLPDPLDNPTNLWLTISRQTGAISVSPNAPQDPSGIPTHTPLGFWGERIERARSLAHQNQGSSD